MDESWIPVLRPRLPAAATLQPYLERIDARRVYSNWGPLTEELEARLGERLQASVVTASSGTAAIVAAVLARAGRATAERPLAAVAAFTFVATAVAAEQAGYAVALADVDPDTWILDPAGIDLDRTGVVIVTAPFGRPVPQAPWAQFERRTGIPVVIDGAACFEALEDDPHGLLGDIPVAVSFHATKSFSTGEGGCVVQTGAGDAIARALNFGFWGTRETTAASINGKLSEYHAAIGLAELDDWAAKRAAFAGVADRYRELAADAGIAVVARPETASPYVLFPAPDASSAERAEAALEARGLDSRLWYGYGVHRHAYFAGGSFPVTEDLAPRLLGLPVAVDLPDHAIGSAVAALAEAA